MIRSDIFPRFSINIGRIKKGFSGWDRYAVRVNSHRRKIPAQVETDFSATIRALVPENVPVKNIELSVLSISELVSRGEWSNDVQTSIMTSGNPFIIQYTIDALQVVFLEELVCNFSDDELTALFIHDLMYTLLTTMADNRLKRMMAEFFSAVKNIARDDIDKAMTILSVYIATSQFRNPYIDGIGVTGIDDTIISILMPSEIDQYNSAVYRFNKTADIKTALNTGNKDLAKELAIKLVNDQMDSDIFTARLYARYQETGMLNMYYDMLHPIINVRVKLLTNNTLNEAVSDANSMISSKMSGNTTAVVNRKAQEASWNVDELLGSLSNKQVKTVSQVRYDIDKLAVLVSTIEDEDERLNALYKAKVIGNDIQKLYIKTTGAAATQENHKFNMYLRGLDKSVTDLRERIVTMKISPKKYGVFMELPAGYEI